MFSLSPFRKTSDLPFRDDEKRMAWLSGVQLSSPSMPRLSRVKRWAGLVLVPPGLDSAKYTSSQERCFSNDRRFPSCVIVRNFGSKSLQGVSCPGLPAASPVLGFTPTCQRLYFACVEGDSAA